MLSIVQFQIGGNAQAVVDRSDDVRGRRGALAGAGGLNNGLSGPAEVGQRAITGLIFGNTLYAIDGHDIYTYTVSPTSVSALLETTAITGVSSESVFVSAVAGSVPEPSTMILASIAIVAVGFVHARRRYLPA
ncbi:MAG TPA: PEP-CTERM sorting domain-containing protein [Gemmataceae bacterium]|nr:PEP-CTERM sorting domain-containing protein [Gemmataceae bacterium]